MLCRCLFLLDNSSCWLTDPKHASLLDCVIDQAEVAPSSNTDGLSHSTPLLNPGDYFGNGKEEATGGLQFGGS